MTVEYTVEVQNANDEYELVPFVSLKYDDPSTNFSEIPEFEVETDNQTGRRTNLYSVGKLCRIKRDNTTVFIGIIEPRSFTKQGSGGSTMLFGGTHQGYARLRDRVCDYYRADNNSYASVVNPWQFGRLTDDDNELVDGLRPDEILECLIGTKFIWQEWFDDHAFLRWSTVNPELVVYDGGLKLPHSTLPGDPADAYAVTGQVDSVGLYNGDKYVDEMGTITAVVIKLVGEHYTNCTTGVYVCRNMDATTPTWHYVATTYDGDGVWTADYTFSDSPTVKNQFGYRIAMNSDGLGTDIIDYARFDCTTSSDTGVTVGSIQAYNDPNTSDDTIAVNLAGYTRLEAIEKVREITNTSTIYADVNWDAYVDVNSQFYFSEVRGTTIAKTFSFNNRNVTILKQKNDGKIKNALIALGQGEEPYAVTLVGSDVQDAASIATYGKKTGYFIDKSIPDAPTLYKRAKAYLKYMATPRESLDIEICNDPAMAWEVGDSVKIEDDELGINDYYRVLSRSVMKAEDQEEKIDIELGTKSNTVGGLFRNIQDRFTNQEVITQGTGSPTNTLAAGLVFDKDTSAEYSFYVPKNAQNVSISVKTNKFRAYSKATSGLESAHTHDITGETTGTTQPYVTSGISDVDPSQGSAVFTQQVTDNKSGASESWVTFHTFYMASPHTGGVVFFARVKVVTDVTALYMRIYDGSSYYPDSSGIGGSGSMLSGEVSQFCLPTALDASMKTYQLQIKCITSGGTTWNATVWAQIWGYAQHTHAYGTYRVASHAHPVTGFATEPGSQHSHPIQFGIYEYTYYPAKVGMRIDSLLNPIVGKFGLIGSESTQATVTDLDITDNLRDSNGKLVEGMHTLYFSSQSSTHNTLGLGIISVAHKIIVNTSDVDLEPLPEE